LLNENIGDKSIYIPEVMALLSRGCKDVRAD